MGAADPLRQVSQLGVSKCFFWLVDVRRLEGTFRACRSGKSDSLAGGVKGYGSFVDRSTWREFGCLFGRGVQCSDLQLKLCS